jgi:hypothetical protein
MNEDKKHSSVFVFLKAKPLQLVAVVKYVAHATHDQQEDHAPKH